MPFQQYLPLLTYEFRLKAIALFVALAGVIAVFLAFAPGASAVSAPSLGAAASFAVLGGQTVTNTGPTIVHGDLGVSPGTACTGFPSPCTGGPGTVSGKIHAADAVAGHAQSAITAAYNVLAGDPCGKKLAADLAGKSLVSGVYCFDGGKALLTGKLTLNGPGVYIFQTKSTLISKGAASVSLINGASPCNIFWQVGSSATLGTNTVFKGNILALTSITLDTGAKDAGGLYARNGAVTLDHNVVDNSLCQSTPSPTPSPSPSPTPGLPNTGSDPNA